MDSTNAPNPPECDLTSNLLETSDLQGLFQGLSKISVRKLLIEFSPYTLSFLKEHDQIVKELEELKSKMTIAQTPADKELAFLKEDIDKKNSQLKMMTSDLANTAEALETSIKDMECLTETIKTLTNENFSLKKDLDLARGDLHHAKLMNPAVPETPVASETPVVPENPACIKEPSTPVLVESSESGTEILSETNSKTSLLGDLYAMYDLFESTDESRFTFKIFDAECNSYLCPLPHFSCRAKNEETCDLLFSGPLTVVFGTRVGNKYISFPHGILLSCPPRSEMARVDFELLRFDLETPIWSALYAIPSDCNLQIEYISTDEKLYKIRSFL